MYKHPVVNQHGVYHLHTLDMEECQSMHIQHKPAVPHYAGNFHPGHQHAAARQQAQSRRMKSTSGKYIFQKAQGKVHKPTPLNAWSELPCINHQPHHSLLSSTDKCGQSRTQVQYCNKPSERKQAFSNYVSQECQESHHEGVFHQRRVAVSSVHRRMIDILHRMHREILKGPNKTGQKKHIQVVCPRPHHPHINNQPSRHETGQATITSTDNPSYKSGLSAKMSNHHFQKKPKKQRREWWNCTPVQNVHGWKLHNSLWKQTWANG